MEQLIVSLDFLEFPPSHTCDGENLSPRIRLKGLKRCIGCSHGVQPV